MKVPKCPYCGKTATGWFFNRDAELHFECQNGVCEKSHDWLKVMVIPIEDIEVKT